MKDIQIYDMAFRGQYDLQKLTAKMTARGYRRTAIVNSKRSGSWVVYFKRKEVAEPS